MHEVELLTNVMMQSSPFYEDAQKYKRYLEATEVHTGTIAKLLISNRHKPDPTFLVTNRLFDTLAEAVRSENYRIHAYEAQQRCVGWSNLVYCD